jgi:hypothetical protein
MSKYIIKNCPCYTSKGGYYDCWANQDTWCENITDCVLKQIVNNLKLVAILDHCSNCDGVGYGNGCAYTGCGTYQALKSLELLDIQEVE